MKALQNNKKVIIWKARQLGLSWLIVAFCTWKALFCPNTKILFISKDEKAAWDMVSKCRYILQQITSFPIPKLDPDSRSEIGMPTINSEIIALSSTKDAGRSTDATIVIRDELDYHEYGEGNYLAIAPTVDAGGQLIEMSTRDKIYKPDDKSHFRQRFVDALNGRNNTFPIFLGWKLRPVRVEGISLDDWYEQLTREYTDSQLEAEYPATLEEALAPSKTRAFFNEPRVNEMLRDVWEPMSSELAVKYSPYVKIYKEPTAAGKYCLFCDPGSQEDKHATVVIDTATGEEVACSFGKCAPDLACRIYDELVRFYNKAYNCFEANAQTGGRFIEIITQLGTPNMHVQKEGRTGYWESGPIKRDALWGLEEAIRLNLIKVHTREAITEFRNFIVLAGKEPQKMRGQEDDFIDAWKGVWAISKVMPRGKIMAYSFQYRDS